MLGEHFVVFDLYVSRSKSKLLIKPVHLGAIAKTTLLYYHFELWMHERHCLSIYCDLKPTAKTA